MNTFFEPLETRTHLSFHPLGFNFNHAVDAADMVVGKHAPPKPAPSPAPANPTGLTATVLSDTSAALKWVDNATNEAGYYVYAQLADGGANTIVATLPINSTAWTDTSLQAGTKYNFQVAAFGNGYISYSSGATVTTTGAGPDTLPADPTLAQLRALPLLAEPSDIGSAPVNLAGQSLWGSTGAPKISAVNQGQLSDCYFLAGIEEIALQRPALLTSNLFDLGDGTFAARFYRNGTPVWEHETEKVAGPGYYSAPNGGSVAYEHSSDGIWAMLEEKAFAAFRYSSNTYSSLNGGSISETFMDFGLTITSVQATASAMASALASGHLLEVGTNSSVPYPLVSLHAYAVENGAVDTVAGTIKLDNPWGGSYGAQSYPVISMGTFTSSCFITEAL